MRILIWKCNKAWNNGWHFYWRWNNSEKKKKKEDFEKFQASWFFIQSLSQDSGISVTPEMIECATKSTVLYLLSCFFFWRKLALYSLSKSKTPLTGLLWNESCINMLTDRKALSCIHTSVSWNNLKVLWSFSLHKIFSCIYFTFNKPQIIYCKDYWEVYFFQCTTVDHSLA